MIARKIVKCSRCGSNTSLYRVEMDSDGIKVYVCAKHPRNAEKQAKKVKDQNSEDDAFYRHIWKHTLPFCAECGRQLNRFDWDLFHHVLPKNKYPDYRHDERNIVLLCGKFGCHGKAESAISYPKMKIFELCELTKKVLLAESGIEYAPKTSQ